MEATQQSPISQEDRERRRLSRFFLNMPAVLVPRGPGTDAAAFTAQTRDISAHGAFVYIDHPPGVGTRVTIEMQTVIDSLPEILNTTNQITIKVKGKVVRRSADGVGIRFDASLKFQQLVEDEEVKKHE